MKLGATLPVLLATVVMMSGPASAQGTPKKVSLSEAAGATATKVPPEYPPVAKQLRLQGVVELEAVVTETGAVETVNVVSGNPVLTKPAAAAVKKWKFHPFTEGGKPVRALAPVTISFKL